MRDGVDGVSARTNVWPKTRLDGAGGLLGLSLRVNTSRDGYSMVAEMS